MRNHEKQLDSRYLAILLILFFFGPSAAATDGEAGPSRDAPINDHCINAIDINDIPGCETWPGPNGDEMCSFLFSNIDADTDGEGFFSCEGGASLYYGSDIWYTVNIPAGWAGDVTLSACNYCLPPNGGPCTTDDDCPYSDPKCVAGECSEWCTSSWDCDAGQTCDYVTDYDEFHDVYLHASGVCGCGDDLGERLACNDEGCGFGIEPGGPATLTVDVVGPNCYTLRVGGCNPGSGYDQGDGRFRVIAFLTELPPQVLPEACGAACETDVVPCEVDADCRNQSICVKLLGGATGVCYAPKHRYLSMVANPETTTSTARRISLWDDGDPGTILGWVGAPYTNAGLTLADVLPEPDYEDPWPDLLHVSDCEIATGQVYCVQSIEAGADIGDELNYSPCLRLNTPTTWGDVGGGGFPEDACPPANGYVSLDDVFAKIKYFQANPIAPLTWLDDGPSGGANRPNQAINLDDIMNTVSGFMGDPYPGLGPLDCP
jgi:hypothetical protein